VRHPADLPQHVEVQLSATDCEVIVVALADLRTLRGDPAWSAPAVVSLRRKIAAAIGVNLGDRWGQ
jgi:hypothetical protein